MLGTKHPKLSDNCSEAVSGGIIGSRNPIEPSVAGTKSNYVVLAKPIHPLSKLMKLSTQIERWLIPLSGILALVGYFGPWVNHRVAGLVIMGLDLGEYVKFLPEVRNGQITLWREGFYLPLAAVSLTFSLHVFRKQLAYHWLLRAFLVALAIIAALNMLPPAWTPDRLVTPEFRWQTAMMLICLAAVAISPFLALIPPRISAALVVVLSGLALWFPIHDFLSVLPLISGLYRHALQPGWGMMVMAGGLLVIAGAGIWCEYYSKQKSVN